MGLFDFLFKNKKDALTDFKKRGAIILDVRTKKEYDAGNITGSKNIPLQELGSRMGEVKKLDKPIITCCLSGGRSANATKILKDQGVEAINGGGWQNLNKKLLSRNFS